MRNIYKNQYKRHDIFSCNHSSHHRFGGAVSTYYILQEKHCYPDGCLNFVWRCQLLNKGHACPRKFRHVGRKCFSCKHFYENKYQQKPRLLVSPDEYREYLHDLENFKYWIGLNRGRKIDIDAQIASVKPDLSAAGSPDNPRFRFHGWILVFDHVYVGYDLFEDIAFARISAKTQNRFQFAGGDSFEAVARFNFNQGRLVFSQVHNIEIKARGEGELPDSESILVAAETATSFPVQPEKCMRCDQGVLIENMPSRSNRSAPSRSLVCLMGQKNPVECLYHLDLELKADSNQ